MRQKISIKLFLVILAACALVLAVNGVFARITFMRDFIGYLNEQGIERMQGIAPRIGEAYAEHGSWAFLEERRENWFYLLRPLNDEHPAVRSVPPLPDQTGVVLRLGLFDMQDKLLAGNASIELTADTIRLPIESAGRQVGWLAMLPFQKVLAAGDVRFYQAQVRAWWVNGIASVLIAALLAFLLPRGALRRLQALTHFVHRLTVGDYSQRIPHSNRDELDYLADDISQLAGKLEHIEDNRRAFMADISHELRTPLAVLKAELEAIQDGIRPLNMATLAPLHSVVQQMNKLVDDLYELSVTQSGRFTYDFATLDWHRLVQGSATTMQARAADAGLQLQLTSTAAPLFVLGDENRLLQLLSNLLENAIRYTDHGGKIQLQLMQEGHQAVLILQDTAPGVAPDKCARLFDRFYRVDASRNRASGGSGLGLAICRNIVETHGGCILADASPLGGLRIRVHLPIFTPPTL